MVRTFEITSGEARTVSSVETLPNGRPALPPGAYTTVRTYDGTRVVRFAQHLRRLEDSVAAQGFPDRLHEETVRAGLAAALAATRYPESRLRVTFAPPRLFVTVEPFVPLPSSLYEEGVACATVAVRRENPHAKDTRFLSTAGRVHASLPPGVHEGLMVGEDGAVLEGLSSNFFAVREGVLHTEEERALAGVTRSLVLEAARSLLPVATTGVRVEQLRAVSEGFLTSVSRGILPVVRIDEVRIGAGRPGACTREIRARFEELVEREAEPLLR